MNKLSQRGQAFERHFQTQQEKRFYAESSAIKSVGLWSAGVLGLSGDMASDYADDVLTAYLAANGSPSAIEKIVADCEVAEKNISRRSLSTLLSIEIEKFMALMDEDAEDQDIIAAA